MIAIFFFLQRRYVQAIVAQAWDDLEWKAMLKCACWSCTPHYVSCLLWYVWATRSSYVNFTSEVALKPVEGCTLLSLSSIVREEPHRFRSQIQAYWVCASLCKVPDFISTPAQLVMCQAKEESQSLIKISKENPPCQWVSAIFNGVLMGFRNAH